MDAPNLIFWKVSVTPQWNIWKVAQVITLCDMENYLTYTPFFDVWKHYSQKLWTPIKNDN